MQKEDTVKFTDVKKREDDEKLILEQEEHQLIHFIDSDPPELKLEIGEEEQIEKFTKRQKNRSESRIPLKE